MVILSAKAKIITYPRRIMGLWEFLSHRQFPDYQDFTFFGKGLRCLDFAKKITNLNLIHAPEKPVS
jgi:hypothetical protein